MYFFTKVSNSYDCYVGTACKVSNPNFEWERQKIATCINSPSYFGAYCSSIICWKGNMYGREVDIDILASLEDKLES